MKYVGSSVTSLTDARLVSGRGTYTADVQLDGMLSVAVVRSPYAHALIRQIDSSAAAAFPGVVCVVTGREIRENTPPMPDLFGESVGGKSYKGYALCTERARYVGEPVAAVVAEDKYTARKAADLVEVDYQELPAVTDAEEAMKPESPLVEPSWGQNLAVKRGFRAGDVGKAFAEADGTVKGRIKTHRYTASPIEPRAYVAAYDRFADRLTFWASTQAAHQLRVYLAESLGISEASIRVIQPNVGGAFGSKLPLYQEEVLVAYLARKLGPPVKWVEERTESLLAGGHARQMCQDYEAAYKKDGTVTGLNVRIVADLGAPASLGGWWMALVAGMCIPTVYKIPNCQVELFPVVTNKCPWNAYRGFGKESASLLMDRVMDHVAQASGLDRAEVRFRNFIQPEEFPYRQVSGAVLDSGNYPKAMKRVLELIGYRDFPARQAEARKQGRFVGIGIGQELCPEGCVSAFGLFNGYEGATVRINSAGEVSVLTGVSSAGSGNETAIAQIVADTVGTNVKKVRVQQGDTELCPFGLGNFSSRSILIGGGAAQTAAAELREKLFKVAGKMLEVLPADLEAEDGKIHPKGSSHGVTVQEVASSLYMSPFGRNTSDVEPALEATRYFRLLDVCLDEQHGPLIMYPSWSNGAVACIVEVDPETGVVKLLRCCMVHDSGVVVNPRLAEANVQGGMAQGLGGALYEHLVYDENGQLRTATLMDYTLPTAAEVPLFEIEHQETPSPFNPLGAKGVGETGVTGILGAICGAIENALPHLRLRIAETPLKPDRLWEAIRVAQREAAP